MVIQKIFANCQCREANAELWWRVGRRDDCAAGRLHCKIIVTQSFNRILLGLLLGLLFQHSVDGILRSDNFFGGVTQRMELCLGIV